MLKMDNNDAVESLVPKSGKYSTKQANSQLHSHQKEDTPADPSVSLSSSAVMFDGTASSLDSHPFDNVRKTLLKYLRFVGPGLMITVAYMDPGNYATAVSAGAANRFAHLSIVLLSGAIAIFLQALCIKLGSVTGFDLSQACREFFPMWLNICLYLISEIAIISTDVAEVIGGAIALNILLRIPLPAGVCISCTDVFLVLLAYRPETSSMRMVRMFEMLVAMLVFAVTICLCIELAYIPPFSVKEMLRGFLPSGTIFSHKGVYIATSILGATVMPHSLFLGSGLVRPRLLEYDVKNGYYSTELDSNADLAEEKSVCKELRKEKIYMNYRPSIHAIRYAMKFSVTEVAVTLIIFALFINCSILIIAACSLYGTEEAIDADLYTIHDLLSKSLTPVAGTVFMLALLFSGQSSGIVCTIAGQMVCEGHIRWNLTPWKRRFITRGIAIIPCLIISVSIGKNGLSQALNASQVVLSCTLPFITAPLIYFTSKKSLMSVPADKRKVEDGSIACVDGDDADAASDCESQLLKKYVDFSNNWLTITVGCGIWVGICALVLYTYVSLGLSNGE